MYYELVDVIEIENQDLSLFEGKTNHQIESLRDLQNDVKEHNTMISEYHTYERKNHFFISKDKKTQKLAALEKRINNLATAIWNKSNEVEGYFREIIDSSYFNIKNILKVDCFSPIRILQFQNNNKQIYLLEFKNYSTHKRYDREKGVFNNVPRKK